ncbi:Arylsulfatase B [Acropora cervicornis]|uniref:Arylsulfatase B n=1 Tax=Acropora cervicornis TaxID=6130 RepID=A0AAD9QTC9_ACRCE|nr:Arylsulfatase B [Acropora cervicornis]
MSLLLHSYIPFFISEPDTGVLYAQVQENSLANFALVVFITTDLNKITGGKFDPRNPIPVDGFDVWKTISQGDPSPRTEILLNIDNVDPNATLPGIYQGMGLRMGSMKLLMNVPNTTWFKPPELGAGTLDVALYNITADPEERNDLSQVLPDVVKKMKERMDYYINSSVPPLFKGTDPDALKIARKNGIWGPWMKSEGDSHQKVWEYISEYLSQSSKTHYHHQENQFKYGFHSNESTTSTFSSRMHWIAFSTGEIISTPSLPQVQRGFFDEWVSPIAIYRSIQLGHLRP